MKLIVGLGNPGKKYETTRHNAGAIAVLEFMRLNTPPFAKLKMNKKFNALVTKGELNEEEIILALPQTFMNNSGQAVKTIASYYKLEPEDIWVVYDDVDLPLGKIRISRNGSAAGHKGVQSIIDQLKTKDFIRFRLGISNSLKSKITTPKFVLQNFSKEEKNTLTASVKKTNEAIEFALKSEIEKTMNKFN
jgi:PTH1 family peptidyl-tRNA hydrolase